MTRDERRRLTEPDWLTLLAVAIALCMTYSMCAGSP